MSDHIEAWFVRLTDASDAGHWNEVRALLWDLNAEAWERGVMFGGGVGTIKPPRGPNPYRTGNPILTTETP